MQVTCTRGPILVEGIRIDPTEPGWWRGLPPRTAAAWGLRAFADRLDGWTSFAERLAAPAGITPDHLAAAQAAAGADMARCLTWIVEEERLESRVPRGRVAAARPHARRVAVQTRRRAHAPLAALVRRDPGAAAWALRALADRLDQMATYARRASGADFNAAELTDAWRHSRAALADHIEMVYLDRRADLLLAEGTVPCIPIPARPSGSSP